MAMVKSAQVFYLLASTLFFEGNFMLNIKRILLSVCAAFYAVNASAEVVVIVHPSNNEVVEVQDIKKIYFGKSTAFPSGKKAVPLNLKKGDKVRKEFLEGTLEKKPSQFASIWSRLVFSGRSKPPKTISAEQMIKIVSSDPSSIGYIDAASVTSDVKVIYRK